jgi:hypothetical protein
MKRGDKEKGTVNGKRRKMKAKGVCDSKFFCVAGGEKISMGGGGGGYCFRTDI